MQEKDINNAKKELADLYLILKSGNSKDVNNISFDLILFNFIGNRFRAKRKRIEQFNKKAIKRVN